MALGDLVETTQHFTLRLNPLLPLSPQLHALHIVLTSPGRRLALDLQQELLNCPGACSCPPPENSTFHCNECWCKAGSLRELL